ncbi:MAG: hypothetical protein MRY63_02125 [Neomegalonema sp.]|nr:hypothetical protein [Neomegalonema sp.]
MRRFFLGLCAASIAVCGASALAGDVEVVAVTPHLAADGASWTFDVTLRHGDTGWEHYADAWEVLTPQGEILATRVLHHPHENEQPFTRSLSGIAIPEDLCMVMVRGHDKVHGYSSAPLSVELCDQQVE